MPHAVTARGSSPGGAPRERDRQLSLGRRHDAVVIPPASRYSGAYICSMPAITSPSNRRSTDPSPFHAHGVSALTTTPESRTIEPIIEVNGRRAAAGSGSEAVTTERDRALSTALGQIERSHGKGAIMRLGEARTQRVEAIPTGALTLDIALGVGGVPRGRVIEIYGPESSGKTTLTLHVIAEAQKLGGVAAFIDAEHALDPQYAARIGVKTDELLISQPDTGEQALEIVEVLVRSGAVDVVVIDSVAALVPKAEIDGEMGDSHVGLQARLMSQAMRKLTAAISPLQHLRHLHQPAAREDRRHVRQPRDHHRAAAR